MKGRQIIEAAKEALGEWQKHKASIRAAALAFFIILPLPSLLFIILAILSYIYGQTGALDALIRQITAVTGPTVANLVQELLDAIKTPFTSVFATFTTVVFTIGGAVGAFGVLQDTMNNILEIKPPKGLTLLHKIKQKIIPFLLVTFLGFGIIIWTATTTAILGLLPFSFIPIIPSGFLLRLAQITLSFILSALLFAVIFKQLPDAPIKWMQAAPAALITAAAFTVTNTVIGFIIETFTLTTVTGTAGSLMILLLWIFIINQIILYGAAFTKTYTKKQLIQTKKKPKQIKIESNFHIVAKETEN